jgi:hypothetical protein
MEMSMHKDAVHAGQSAYTPFSLKLYDQAVLGLSCRWVWKCPSRSLLAHYQQHISGNHLDVGVGTGYFLDKVRFPVSSPRVVLMDLNPNSLSCCAQRIARYQPQVHRCNALVPVVFTGERFDSLAMNLLLHCLPGRMEEKGVVLDNLLPLLNPGATVFGATLLHDGVERSSLAKGLMWFYNRKGIFTNAADSDASLARALDSCLVNVQVRVEGCMALFSGQVPASHSST